MRILGGFPWRLSGEKPACQWSEFKANKAAVNMGTQASVLFMDVAHVLFNSFIHRQKLVAIRFLQLPRSLLNALEIHPSGYVYLTSLLFLKLCSVV